LGRLKTNYLYIYLVIK